jgi:hypothetical protein
VTAGFAHGDDIVFVALDPGGNGDVDDLVGTVMSLEDSRREEDEPIATGDAEGRPKAD